MNKHEINKAGIAFAEKMFVGHGSSVDRPPVTKGPVDLIASLNGRTMRIKVRAISQIGSYVFMEKRRFNICDTDLWVCQEFCVNFFRNLYHTSTLIRSYDHL